MDKTLEYSVVGAAVNNPASIPEVLTKITPADLWNPKAETVLTAVADLWAETSAVDALSVAQKLSGGQVSASDVFEMVELACVPASLNHHLGTIANRAQVRRLGSAGQRIATLAEQGSSPQDIAQQAQELIDGAIRVDESQVRRVGETLGETMEGIRAAARGETDAGLPTGIADLDSLINGLAGGQMVIVAARPGVGKSTLAVDFMRHASAKLDVPSLLFSLEMGANEVNQRILAAEASVPLSGIINGTLTDNEWAKVDATAARLNQVPLYVDASSETTMVDIAAKSRMYVERKQVGLVVVDYLQLLRADGVVSREQEIASYSRQMKLLAKSLGVPVVVIAQLNRESVRRGGKPMVSDLRESGSLEQDADVIMLIDRPDAADPNDARAGEADIVVGKNRRGRTGVATVVAQLKYSRFSNMAGGSN